MAKWIILSLFVFSITLYAPSDAYARRSSSSGHSHGRSSRLSFQFPLPLHKSHSRPANPAPTYNRPIYVKKDYPLPRVYSLKKPLVDDARIYRPLFIRKKSYHPAGFYRYDHEKDEYSTARILHADSQVALAGRYLSVEIDGEIFYYNDGFFYKEEGKHFIVVPPVVNSIVPRIPKSSANIGFNSHEYNGIYYRKISQGYQVVGSPTIK